MAEIEQLRGKAHNTAIAALEVVPFAMLITDASAQALAVNGKWLELSGLGRANSLGPGWLSVLEPDVRARLREDVVRVGRDGGSDTVDYQIGASPRKRWTRWWISRHELEGFPLIAVGAADVDEDYSRQANLYHLATHDSLTGLINRSHFLECIDQALRRSQRQSRHVAVVYVDLDGFKRVNDRGGHSLGDRVLFAIASRLRHAVRSADMVARIGGDEFAVLCEGLTAAEQADVVARRIALALTESVELDGERWSVAASVGAAIDRGDPDSAEDLVDRADRAMYSIKLNRRGPEPTVDDEAPTEAAVSHHGGEPAEEAAPAPAFAYGAGPGTERRSPLPSPPAPAPPFSAAPDGPAGGADTGPAAPATEPIPILGRLDVLDPDDARRALRELAEAAGAFAAASSASSASSASAGPSGASGGSGSSGTSGSGSGSPDAHEHSAPRATVAVVTDPDAADGISERAAAAEDPARSRLAADVLHLRESIDSIRKMLDRLVGSENGVIDIREQPPR